MSDPAPPPPQKPYFTTRVILMGVLLAFLANLVLIALVGPKPLPEQEEMVAAMNLLRESQVSQPSKAQLAEGALTGMAESLHDPYTQFFPGRQAAQWDRRLSDADELHPLGNRPEQWMIDPQKGVGYAALGCFTSHSAADLRRALAAMKNQNMRGLILDLRGNPGGFLIQAQQVASLFLPKGSPVAKVAGPALKDRLFATDSPPVTDAPLVVLIDENTASASEVVAGALQDHHRALIVGARSFGKGCVQNVVDMPALNGKLKVTTGYYFLPSGRCLHRNGKSDWGVAPSPGAQVLMTADARKSWAATRQLAPGAGPLTPEAQISAEFLRDQLHDAPLAAAYAALLGRLSGGAWPRVGDDPSPGTEDPRWQLRDEIRRTETKLRHLRHELSTPQATP